MARNSRFLGAAALTFGAFVGAGSAAAQGVPPGSYQSSCEDVSVSGDTLRARCETADGDWSNSRLDDLSACDGDISNDDGRLTCARRDDGPGMRGDDDPGDSDRDSARGDGRDDDRGGDGRDDDRDDGRDDDRGDRVPSGSYQETCNNERVEGSDLVADCADRNGRWRHSELANHRFCRGDIANANGVLRCDRDADAAPDDYTVPTGAWRATCRDAHVSGSILTAECRNRVGRFVASSLDLRACRQGVANVNGRLACIVPATLGWRITLYKNTGYAGTSRTFIGDVPDLARYGMANVASSAALRSGAWQLCTRTYYRGRCVTLRASAPNFRRLGINDRARSLRRVR